MNPDEKQLFTERTRSVVNAAKLLSSSGRKKAGRFLVEGPNLVEAAVAAGKATDIFTTVEADDRYAGITNPARSGGVYVHLINDRAAAHLSDTVTTTGLFAVCEPVVVPLDQALGDSPREVVVAVSTTEPGNTGTLLRLAAGLGADCVVLAGQCADPQSGKAARASAGSLFTVPVARVDDVDRVLAEVKKRSLTVVATALDCDTSLGDHRADELLAGPVAWLFGNEAHGLDPRVLEQSDVRMNIPITGKAESLNVAAAAAICLWETARVRGRQ
ncbi:TrmH family RNA methyltransferase [Corynebacterium mendelii]|uniref:RNA methyltransferase n=1 Tax=Corynebacterium mendelii TaxID=2765362 RepID=A0A939E2G3_9CORY|nr:RNA methyltransferase [Corynebacterium mendelii]